MLFGVRLNLGIIVFVVSLRDPTHLGRLISGMLRQQDMLLMLLMNIDGLVEKVKELEAKIAELTKSK